MLQLTIIYTHYFFLPFGRQEETIVHIKNNAGIHNEGHKLGTSVAKRNSQAK